MNPLLLLPLGLCSPGDDPADLVEVGAFIEADELSVGEPLFFLVDAFLEDGWSASEAGAPAFFLQLDVPACVELAGPYLRTHRELAGNEFLQLPFERLLEQLPASVEFQLIADPEPGDVIAMNVVGYVVPDSGEPFFLRRRLELLLEPGAEARVVDSSNSAWGEDESLLQIGDDAPAFTLPRPDGSKFAMSDWLGQRNVIVVTYRAHW